MWYNLLSVMIPSWWSSTCPVARDPRGSCRWRVTMMDARSQETLRHQEVAGGASLSLCWATEQLRLSQYHIRWGNICAVLQCWVTHWHWALCWFSVSYYISDFKKSGENNHTKLPQLASPYYSSNLTVQCHCQACHPASSYHAYWYGASQ